MSSTDTIKKSDPLSIIGTDDKWEILRRYQFAFKDFVHGAIGEIGPWPQPAPDNPVRQIAQVIHLPESELKDWKKNVGNMYRRVVLTRWPEGLWYIFKHKHYKRFDDSAFNEEISEGLYSKFLTELDTGDLDIFKQRIPQLEGEDAYYKADFSCMEPIVGNCYDGYFTAPTITLLKRNSSQCDFYGHRHKVLAIYIYSVSESGQALPGKVLTPDDGKEWELAKYYVLHGAANRINLTEHALLHFPYDSVNAVTRTVLPKDHLLFKLLFPHLRLSLPVDKAVLENSGSLINREKRTFYSPFCAPGIYIRQLLADGYIGREGKEKGYPVFSFPRQPKINKDTGYGCFLQSYYDVFRSYVAKVLAELNYPDSEPLTETQLQEREMIGLWAECISEWVPGFPGYEELLDKQKRLDVELLINIVTNIIWGLSVAHGVDHIAIHKKQSHGIPFNLRVAPPDQSEVPDDWYERLVTRSDLFRPWFTDVLFYEPHNVTLLQEVDYAFSDSEDWDEDKKQRLIEAQKEFINNLHECDRQLEKDNIQFARLGDIPNSIQY